MGLSSVNSVGLENLIDRRNPHTPRTILLVLLIMALTAGAISFLIIANL